MNQHGDMNQPDDLSKKHANQLMEKKTFKLGQHI